MHGCYRACFPVFPTFQRFSCFPVFFLFLFFLCFFFVFSRKFFLNFQVFSYTGFLQILENLENLEKSTNFIKVMEKSGIFFILKAVCIYFLSFLRMINIFLVYFLYVYFIERGCFDALFYIILHYISLDNCFLWLNEISILFLTLFLKSSLYMFSYVLVHVLLYIYIVNFVLHGSFHLVLPPLN